MCFWTAFIGCNFELGLRSTAFVCFFVWLNRQGTDMWPNWFRLRMPGALVDLLWIRVICIVPCRLLRHSAFNHWCGRALRVHFSLHCVFGVSTDEFDLAAVSSGSSQRAVLRGLVVHSMSLLLAVPISLDAFRCFAKRLRTCAQPLSVGVWHLEAARFVIRSVPARLNGTECVCLQKHFLLSCVS